MSLGQATQKVRDVKRVLAPSVNKISRAGFGAKKNTEAARLMEALREIGALRPPADGGRDPRAATQAGRVQGDYDDLTDFVTQELIMDSARVQAGRPSKYAQYTGGETDLSKLGQGDIDRVVRRQDRLRTGTCWF